MEEAKNVKPVMFGIYTKESEWWQNMTLWAVNGIKIDFSGFHNALLTSCRICKWVAMIKDLALVVITGNL